MSATIESSRLLKALNAVDTLKREREEAESLLEDQAQDATTEKLLREMLTVQGGDVDDATIAQAVALSRKPAELPFLPMPRGLGRTLAELYIGRERWLGKTLGALAAIFIAGSLWWTGNTVMEARFQSQAQAAFEQVQSLRSRLSQEQATVAAMPAYEQLKTQAMLALAQARAIAQRVDRQLGGRKPADKQTLATVRSQNQDMQARLNKAHDLVERARRLDSLKAQMAGFEQRGVNSRWPELAAAMRGQKENFAQAMAVNDDRGAADALEKLNHMATADAAREALQASVAGLPAAAQDSGQALLAQGEAALLAGNSNEAAETMARLDELKVAVASAYTMRIVNEPGVKSGVWRYPNDNPSARNYYIVVDALDGQNKPVRVMVRNEETGKNELVSRFAVRVPESFYEKVKADKTDNGLIDNDLVGRKAAGELDPSFAVPVAGGIITSW